MVFYLTLLKMTNADFFFCIFFNVYHFVVLCRYVGLAAETAITDLDTKENLTLKFGMAIQLFTFCFDMNVVFLKAALAPMSTNELMEFVL